MTTSIQRVAIIGLGIMGTKVAWACAANGLTTCLFDSESGQVRRALEGIAQWLMEDGLAGTALETTRARLVPYDDLGAAVASVDLAFENVPEELELKRRVHAAIGRLAPSAVLMGSNASSLLCSPLAEASGRPELFFNMNFTDPRQRGLVELMPNPRTLPSTIATAQNWARHIGMVPITLHREVMGYSFNRLWRAIKKEALFQVERGYAGVEDIDRAFMLTFGTPCGPFGLMDQVGLHSVLRVERQYHAASGDESDRPPRILADLVAAGHLGESTGRGFYCYPDPAYRQLGWLRMELPWSVPAGRE